MPWLDIHLRRHIVPQQSDRDLLTGLRTSPHVWLPILTAVSSAMRMSFNPQIELARVDPAMPHHDAIGHRYPRQVICFAKINTIGKVGKCRCHAAVHVLRIRQTTEGSGLPFRRFDAPGGLESQLVFAAALGQLPTCKMQIAAEVVDFCESAIVAECECQRLGLRQAGEGIVRPGNQAIGRGATEESAAPVGVFAGDCQSLDVSFESLGPASRVQLKSAHEHSEFECVALLGREQPGRVQQVLSPGPGGTGSPASLAAAR